MRTCEGCRKKDEKEKFLRFVEFEGNVMLDTAGKLPGRGYNVCPDSKCIKQFVKKRFKNRINAEELIKNVISSLREYLLHLLSLCHKTGITVIGQDNVKSFKNREGVLLLSSDLSEKTKERLKEAASLTLKDMFTSEELGNALRKERTAGVVFVEKAGLGRKFYEVAQKLKTLSESLKEK
ncbi:hypothetical protein SAMN06265339_1698 [Desulfurobacterium pacificum]|uniref:YlxR domain-containing protein n=1 Tax=Desulfurobacterium pacificum TaxID=240166 RepID=A0ABY1NWP3_9BACT|nr:YlxR family protein [Desulfurobacterium pacificum]SMP19621.1 hypothetical protein SAMN06265339_1698 [Desulfurobacterium pacificum]